MPILAAFRLILARFWVTSAHFVSLGKLGKLALAVPNGLGTHGHKNLFILLVSSFSCRIASAIFLSFLK